MTLPIEIHRRPPLEVLTEAFDQLAAVLDPVLAALPTEERTPVLGPLLTAATALGQLRVEADRPPLLCAFCLFTREDAEEAVTVLNGQAVCMDHEPHAQGGDHALALVRIRRAEEQRSTDDPR